MDSNLWCLIVFLGGVLLTKPTTRTLRDLLIRTEEGLSRGHAQYLELLD